MINFGCCLGSHYRVLKTEKDINDLIYYFILEKDLKLIELSLYNKRTYNLFYNSYINSQLLKSLSCEKGKIINLHLPRKDWSSIGVKKIIKDVKNLQKKIKINQIIIHESDYENYKENLAVIKKNILVENEEYGGCLINKKIQYWVCDINHFYKNHKFDLIAFRNFIILNNNKIKEIHFSFRNHEVFNSKNISWLYDKLKIVSKESGLANKNLIFEGTNKDAKNLKELKKSLDHNINLILNGLCKI
ncbi:MAG: hypothetical protein MUF50_04775 [Planctomycetes bacterium]|jgi:hypothetical protein|nr:hypothetical protein [Planctomycetota bacterium]